MSLQSKWSRNLKWNPESACQKLSNELLHASESVRAIFMYWSGLHQYIKITLTLSDVCDSSFESFWHADSGFHFRFLDHLLRRLYDKKNRCALVLFTFKNHSKVQVSSSRQMECGGLFKSLDFLFWFWVEKKWQAFYKSNKIESIGWE